MPSGQNPLYQNLWPINYAQKVNLDNGKTVWLKRKGDSANNLITLYAQSEQSANGEFLGEATLNITQGYEQFSIQIVPAYRGQGIGKKFFKTLVALARTLGIQSMAHPPIPRPPIDVIEKWEKLKWLHLEFTPDGQLSIRCQLNQKMGP